MWSHSSSSPSCWTMSLGTTTLIILISSFSSTSFCLRSVMAFRPNVLGQVSYRGRTTTPLKNTLLTMSRPFEQGGTIPTARFASSPSLSSSSSSSSSFTFDEMKQLDERLEELTELSAPEALLDYYESSIYSFSVKPGGGGGSPDGTNNNNRLSITSTCYSVLALLQHQQQSSSSSSNKDWITTTTTTMNDNDETTTTTTTIKGGSSKPQLQSILHALLHSEWRKEDLFQVSLLTYTLLYASPNRTELVEELLMLDDENDNDDNDNDESKNSASSALALKRLVSLVLSARPQRRLGTQQIFSDYILYQCCRVYALLRETLQSLPEQQQQQQRRKQQRQELEMELSLSLTRCAEISLNELCRQLAYRSAGDTTSFDVIRLAYSLLSYLKSTQSLSGGGGGKSSSTLLIGRELIQGGIQTERSSSSESGSSSTTVLESVPPLNRQLVTAAIQAFFEEQSLKDGLWPQGQPIYKSFRKQGRNVGNAFVFSIDTVGSLLEALSPEDIRSHLPSLERTLEWIETHQLVEVIPTTESCSNTNNDRSVVHCYGKPIRGWSSPHLSLGSGPQSWSTAQVVTCLTRMKSTIRKLMHTDVLDEFHGIQISKKGPKPESWNRLLDSDLGGGGGGQTSCCRTIKSVLDERVCIPFFNADGDDTTQTTTPTISGILNPSYGAAYSTILFGPPGTAKTTICESLAERMGWDFVVIDTTAFLADGLTNVSSRIRYVFRRLMALTECVILFDEIEEFCLDRETPGLSMESRMLTTAMLTAINDLRRTKRSVFFLATNRLRAFDSAIIRPGRFDMQLFVGTPNLESRVVQFQQALRDVNIRDTAVIEQVVATYRSFLASVWSIEEDAMFMNFLEGRQFATSAANLVASAMAATGLPVTSVTASPGEEGTIVESSSPSLLLTEDLQTILRQQAAVMTVRGSVREEYIASMELSRL